MTDLVGVERDGDGLREALRRIAQLERAQAPLSRPFLNMCAAATLIAAAALKREESRGGHHRSDHPDANPEARPTETTLAEARAIRDAAEETP
jgi:L-aspartate oxidase